MANFDKLVEGFFKKEENILDANDLKKLLESQMLSEADKNINKNEAREKLLGAIIQKIKAGEPFFLMNSEEPTFIKKELATELENALNLQDNKKGLKIDNLLAKIPIEGGDKTYSIVKFSMRSLTGASAPVSKQKQTDKEGPKEQCIIPPVKGAPVKESLVCYFYNAGDKIINKVYSRLNGMTNEKLALPFDEDKSLLTEAGYNELQAVINYLNCNPPTYDQKVIETVLNAVSSARTILQTFGKGIIDRGDLFNEIKFASRSKIGNDKEDKWTPADVFLYKTSPNKIKSMFSDLNKEPTVEVVYDPEAKKVIKTGLNYLFVDPISVDYRNKTVIGISLKEERARHGKAGGFVKIVRANLVSGGAVPDVKDIEDEEDEDSEDTTETSNEYEGIGDLKQRMVSIFKNKYTASQTKLKNDIKVAYEHCVDREKVLLGLLQGKGKNKFSVIKDPSSMNSNEINAFLSEDPANAMHLYKVLISKLSSYDYFINYLEAFYNNDKGSANEIMKSYDDPLLALTAYAIGLTGFNPPFYKISGDSSGQAAAIEFFSQRGIVEKSNTQITYVGNINKQGFSLKYITMIGGKPYQTRIDTQPKGGKSSFILIEVKELTSEEKSTSISPSDLKDKSKFMTVKEQIELRNKFISLLKKNKYIK